MQIPDLTCFLELLGRLAQTHINKSIILYLHGFDGSHAGRANGDFAPFWRTKRTPYRRLFIRRQRHSANESLSISLFCAMSTIQEITRRWSARLSSTRSQPAGKCKLLLRQPSRDTFCKLSLMHVLQTSICFAKHSITTYLHLSRSCHNFLITTQTH